MPWIILSCITLILAALAAFITVRTVRFKPPATQRVATCQPSEDPAGPKKLAEAVRVATVTEMDPNKTDLAAFTRLYALFQEQFPLVHEQCDVTVINGYSLVYHLKSDNPAPAKKPALITAHLDVVPVETGTEGDWGRAAV